MPVTDLYIESPSSPLSYYSSSVYPVRSETILTNSLISPSYYTPNTLLYVDTPFKGELDVYPDGTQTSGGTTLPANPNASPLDELAKVVLLLEPNLLRGNIG